MRKRVADRERAKLIEPLPDLKFWQSETSPEIQALLPYVGTGLVPAAALFSPVEYWFVPPAFLWLYALTGVFGLWATRMTASFLTVAFVGSLILLTGANLIIAHGQRQSVRAQEQAKDRSAKEAAQRARDDLARRQRIASEQCRRDRDQGIERANNSYLDARVKQARCLGQPWELLDYIFPKERCTKEAAAVQAAERESRAAEARTCPAAPKSQ